MRSHETDRREIRVILESKPPFIIRWGMTIVAIVVAAAASSLFLWRDALLRIIGGR
jgi:hypothetical protein